MTPVEKVLEALRRTGRNPQRSGSSWSVRCPAHDDRRASLSVSTGVDGRALVHCHAACATKAVVSALGLRLRNLMPEREEPPRSGKVKRKTTEATFATAQAAVAELERQHGKRSALWTYHDAEGNPVGIVVRWDRGDGTKDIRPAFRDGERWRIGAMPDPRPLYRLPDLVGATRVLVVEGEKCADAAWALGFVATTSAGGSKAASTTDWRPLAGAATARQMQPERRGAGAGVPHRWGPAPPRLGAGHDRDARRRHFG